MATPLNDRPVGWSVGRPEAEASPFTLPTQKGSLYPPCHGCGVLRCAAPRYGTFCRAILSRVAWLVVSFLYSFVGKSAASLVFKRQQRGSGERRGTRDAGDKGREARGGREAKGKRRPASGGCERARREQDVGSVRPALAWVAARGERKGQGSPRLSPAPRTQTRSRCSSARGNKTRGSKTRIQTNLEITSRQRAQTLSLFLPSLPLSHPPSRSLSVRVR